MKIGETLAVLVASKPGSKKAIEAIEAAGLRAGVAISRHRSHYSKKWLGENFSWLTAGTERLTEKLERRIGRRLEHDESSKFRLSLARSFRKSMR